MATRTRCKRPSNTGAISQVGLRWRVRWRDDGNRRSAMFATKEMAESFLAKRVMDLARQMRPGHAAA